MSEERPLGKPPLPTSNKSVFQTTEKREMSPKIWKANRIRNHNKKIEYAKNTLTNRNPYKSIDRESDNCSVFSKNKSIDKKSKQKYAIGDENLCEIESEEELPPVLCIKETKQPSFMSDKKGMICAAKPQTSSIRGRYGKSTNLNCSVEVGRNGDIQNMKYGKGKTHGNSYHNIRFNHGTRQLEDKPGQINRLQSSYYDDFDNRYG